jgi:hypothetical protein
MSSPEEKRNSAAETLSPAGELSADERWSLVQRVVQDESFRRAPRLRELLLFVAERALDGRSSELNEHDIARAVFRRSDTFNSSDDSIVRSSVRQLRTKLHEYFEGAGRAEPLIIEIPKGGYVPEFPRRPEPAAPAGVQRAEGDVRLWKWIALGSVLAALTFAVLFVRTSTSREQAGTPAKPQNLVTWLFGGRGQDVNIVLCDSALVVVNAYRERMLNLEEYIQQHDQRPLPLPGGKPSGATPPEFPGKRLITSFRDMVFVERLSELSPVSGFQIELKHSRLMQARDFRTGNHILLGSTWSNPWTMLFEEQLNFRFREAPANGAFGLENTRPESGELEFYQCSPAASRNGLSYARIAIVPNLSGQQAVLLVSGLHTESSEGALDSVLSPLFLQQIKQTTGARNPDELIGVEMLLEVRAVDGVVRGTRLVASRRNRKS